MKLIEEIDAMGGMTRAIEAGWPSRKIEETAARRQAAIDSQREVIVGVNKYRAKEAAPFDVRQIDNAAVRAKQIARLRSLRAQRDAGAVERALAALRSAAAAGEAPGRANLLALAVDAARARATVGEISAALESVYGRHRTVPQVMPGSYSAAYSDERNEDLVAVRNAVAQFVASRGRPPRILVAKAGQDGHTRGSFV